MKLNCDIIQDLIPSYVDEICSEATKACVKEHLEACVHCQKVLELCQSNTFSAKDLEKKELDGLKKLKSKLKRQNLFNYLLLLFLCFLGLYTFNRADLPIWIYYVLLAVCLVGTCLFTTHGSTLQAAQKPDLVIVICSVLISAFSLLLMYFCLSQTIAGTVPFGLEPQKVGPLISNCLIVCFVLQLIFTIWLLLHMFRKDRDNRWGLCITQVGVFLSLTYRMLLKSMSSLEGFQNNMLKITIIIFALGAFSIIVCLLQSKKTSRSLH